MQQLHPTMDRFYLSILDYAGMKVEDGIFKNKNEKIGEMTIDGRHLGMPYFDNLKNPNNRQIFHPLNENYTSPETAPFNLFKKRLVLELNLRLSALLVSLTAVAGDVMLQQRIKSSKLIQMVSDIGAVELEMVEDFLKISAASKKVNGEAFLFDIFLKKNGEINDTPYAAIGKVNFLMFNEINRSLAEDEKTYKVFGAATKKKYLMMLDTLFRVVFPGIDNPTNFMEGTDNKIFRYLNILLKTSYQVSARMNEIANMLDELNEPQLKLEEIRSNLNWTKELEELYGMPNEIRVIPNQSDLSVEANKMKLDESKASNVQPQAAPAPMVAPAFDPSRAAPAPAPVAQPVMQPVAQAPQPMSPEDIIRGSIAGGGMHGMMPGMAVPGMMPGMMMPGMMQQQVQVPQWVMQEQMRQQGQTHAPGMQMPQMQMPMQQQVIQTPQGPMIMTPQGMVPAQMMQGMAQMQPQQQIIQTPQGPMIMTPQGMVPAQMMQGMGQPMQQGLALNPHFAQRAAAPFA